MNTHSRTQQIHSSHLLFTREPNIYRAADTTTSFQIIPVRKPAHRCFCAAGLQMDGNQFFFFFTLHYLGGPSLSKLLINKRINKKK